jgi:hypothetical protein
VSGTGILHAASDIKIGLVHDHHAALDDAPSLPASKKPSPSLPPIAATQDVVMADHITLPQSQEEEDDVAQKTEEEVSDENRAKRAAIKLEYEASFLKVAGPAASQSAVSSTAPPCLPTLQALVAKESSLGASASPPAVATPSGTVGGALVKVSLGGGGWVRLGLLVRIIPHSHSHSFRLSPFRSSLSFPVPFLLYPPPFLPSSILYCSFPRYSSPFPHNSHSYI